MGAVSLYGTCLYIQPTEYFIPLFSQQLGHWLIKEVQQSYPVPAFMTQHRARVAVTLFHAAVFACGRHATYFPTTTKYLPGSSTQAGSEVICESMEIKEERMEVQGMNRPCVLGHAWTAHAAQTMKSQEKSQGDSKEFLPVTCSWQPGPLL